MDVLARSMPLSAAQWMALPAPCSGLGRALPAAIAASVFQAFALVQHLPATDAERLRAFGRGLHRAQRTAGVVLPRELRWRILAQAGAAAASKD